MIIPCMQEVEGVSDSLRKRVETVLDLALMTVSSLAESFESDVTISASEDGKESFFTDVASVTKVEVSEVADTTENEKVECFLISCEVALTSSILDATLSQPTDAVEEVKEETVKDGDTDTVVENAAEPVAAQG